LSIFTSIPYIPTSDELLDLVFSQLKKIRVERPSYAKKRRSDLSFYKTLYFRQFRFIFPELKDRLTAIASSFPIIDDLHAFHRELIEELFGIEKLRTALSRIQNTIKSLSSIQSDVSKKLGKAWSADEAKRVRKEALGRTASTIDQIKKPLDFLIEAKIQLMKVPDFSIEEKTIAFAGGPNAGKSSFVEIVSTGKPDIAAYPFTTKELYCGHINFRFERVQLIDTPGLLDRPLHERNQIEMKGIIALKHLADVIIFLFDPVPEASLTLEQQINLKEEIKDAFPEIPLIAYINKKDLLSDKQLSEVRKKVGKLDAIATLDENREELKEVINYALTKIPTDKLLKKKEKSTYNPFEGESTQERDKIEWIFFDEDD
jgi:nucleolar GTP-binding protein